LLPTAKNPKPKAVTLTPAATKNLVRSLAIAWKEGQGSLIMGACLLVGASRVSFY
jgi:hypothetical protein